ncbi:ATP-binding cassette domain-containing protein [Paracoccus sp. p1-h21]|uniref:ATP-binding cassette domain-containing protein n=1 Tax=Paracoccus sp. p1-h21 TaxID=3366951 RepID=UPI003799B19F
MRPFDFAARSSVPCLHPFPSPGLSWSTPDDAPLLTDLNLTFGLERTGIVGRNGIGKSTLLRLISGDQHPAAGQVRMTGTFAILRQEAMEQSDDVIADLFGARPALDLLDRAELGLADADELADADWTLPERMEAALFRCGLSVGPQTLLATLSGVQRSRAVPAALIFAAPDFLLLDEPTNNLDRGGRKAGISDDHFGVDPERLNWADVGSLEYQASLLKQISDFALGEGEHAA